jgi:glycosyltransferase involved in cell wall biosynthesis
MSCPSDRARPRQVGGANDGFYHAAGTSQARLSFASHDRRRSVAWASVPALKILLVHNHYQQLGGEDLVVADEARLLESRGHEVVRYTAHNDEVSSLSAVTLGQRTIWNQHVYRDLRRLIARQQPQIVHVHNTLPLLSPSVYYAAGAEQVPVVQTLHNYRLMCPSAVCYRNGRVCTDCVGKPVAWPAVLHACYRGSRAASAAVVTMLSVHRLAGTWQRKTSVYIALTAMAREMFIAAGLPAGKIVLKPNFVDPDPGPGGGAGGYALFVGRLSAEKGLQTLIEAWRLVGHQVPLRIVGDGPLAPEAAAAAKAIPGVTWLGRRAPHDIPPLLRDAACLVFPSECYETFGRVIAEAFATATPVVAAGHGSAAELVTDGVTGLHFRPGDASDLAATVSRLFSHPEVLAGMRPAARNEFETRFTADVNYRSLMAIYERAIGRSAQPGVA